MLQAAPGCCIVGLHASHTLQATPPPFAKLGPSTRVCSFPKLTSSASPATMLMLAPSSQTLVRGSASAAFLNSIIITRTSPTLPPGGGGVKRGEMTTQRSFWV